MTDDDEINKLCWDIMEDAKGRLNNRIKELVKEKGEIIMNTAVSLPDKNDDEATKIAVGYRWYIFESSAEGNRADMALLSPEEAEVIKKFFDNKITFYDEGYAGDYYMTKWEGCNSKEEAVNEYINKKMINCGNGMKFFGASPDDLVGEFKDIYKEDYKKKEEAKAKWIPSHPTIPAKEFKCTACQGLVHLPVFANECYYNYCPNCGSRNRDEEESKND